MTEEKLAFLRIEDANQEMLDHVQTTVEDELPENFNVLVVSEGITYAEPDEMMEMFLHMFHFIEANCFEDKAEAHKAMNPNQENLKGTLISEDEK